MFFSCLALRAVLLLCLIPLLLLPVVTRAQAPEAGLINRDASAFSPSTGKLYLLDTANDAVTVIARGGKVKSVKVGSRPDAIVLNRRTGVVYVVSPGSRNVSVIDGATDTITATVPTAARPYAIGSHD